MIVRKILAKLHQLYTNDTATLQVKIKHLEILSLLRGKDIQQLILQEEHVMPVTIDIREDLRYQQGVEEGIEKDRIEIAEKMFSNGIDVLLVQNITGLPDSKLEEILKRIAGTKADT